MHSLQAGAWEREVKAVLQKTEGVLEKCDKEILDKVRYEMPAVPKLVKLMQRDMKLPTKQLMWQPSLSFKD